MFHCRDEKPITCAKIVEDMKCPFDQFTSTSTSTDCDSEDDDTVSNLVIGFIVVCGFLLIYSVAMTVYVFLIRAPSGEKQSLYEMRH